jgi:low affinity Fe/Cu permease
MNWYLIIFVAIVFIALTVFVLVRNNTDKKEFEEKLNNDYHKSKEDSDDDIL